MLPLGCQENLLGGESQGVSGTPWAVLLHEQEEKHTGPINHPSSTHPGVSLAPSTDKA